MSIPQDPPFSTAVGGPSEHAEGKVAYSYHIRYAHIAVLAILLVAAYWPTLSRTAEFLLFSEDMAHGFFAPVVAAYVVWLKSRDLGGIRLQPSAFSIPVFLLAAAIAVVGTLGASTTLTRFALILSLVALLLLIGGVAALRHYSFPLALLLFTFPVPSVLYGEITLPLQLLASRLAEDCFEILGYSVVRNGNILELAHLKLAVAEACSGIRSLITLSFFCLVYAYFLEARRWVQATIVLAAVPAAIIMNVMRILASGILGRYNPEFTHGTLHDSLGWVSFCLAFAIVLLVHQIIVRRFPQGSIHA